MAPERRNRIALGVLAVVLAGLAYRAWSPTTETPSSLTAWTLPTTTSMVLT